MLNKLSLAEQLCSYKKNSQDVLNTTKLAGVYRKIPLTIPFSVVAKTILNFFAKFTVKSHFIVPFQPTTASYYDVHVYVNVQDKVEVKAKNKNFFDIQVSGVLLSGFFVHTHDEYTQIFALSLFNTSWDASPDIEKSLEEHLDFVNYDMKPLREFTRFKEKSFNATTLLIVYPEVTNASLADIEEALLRKFSGHGVREYIIAPRDVKQYKTSQRSQKPYYCYVFIRVSRRLRIESKYDITLTINNGEETHIVGSVKRTRRLKTAARLLRTRLCIRYPEDMSLLRTTFRKKCLRSEREHNPWPKSKTIRRLILQ